MEEIKNTETLENESETVNTENIIKEILVINKTPDELTVEELLEIAELFQDFLIKSNLREKLANRFISQQGNNLRAYDFIPDILEAFKNPEARESFDKLMKYIIAQDLPHVAGKQLLDLYKTTITFLNELDIMGFFSQASMVLTRLIKG